MRLYSNLRAYLALGYSVEHVLFHRCPLEEIPGDRSAFPAVTWTTVNVTPGHAGAACQLAYAAAFPMKLGWRNHFLTFDSVRRACEARERRCPGAIHHFEYPTTANVIPWMGGMNTVYGCNDIEAELLRAQMSIDAELQQRAMLPWEKRRVRFADKGERMIARRSNLVLCIARKDAEYMRRNWGCPQAHLLPMSVPSDTYTLTPRSPEGVLGLLHLGSLGHVPSYRSLEFLFENVFPQLGSEELARVRLDVVGRIPDGEHSRRILELGRRWPQVEFHGFAPDLEPFYRRCHLQLVGSTEATGLRTRIVESFAAGLPVLSTIVGADGVEGIRPGENILLAKDAAEFVSAIRRICRDPAVLDSIRAEARNTYERHYGIETVVDVLGQLLNSHFGGRAARRRAP
jgi:hypothetical protein